MGGRRPLGAGTDTGAVCVKGGWWVLATAPEHADDEGVPTLPFDLEEDLERRIAADPDWQAGVLWGAPRSGHPEGAVKWHVAEVLANLDRLDLDTEDRRRLRVAALVHDTWKQAVDRSRDRVPPNEHGFIAAQWLALHVDDPPLVSLVELHDEGFRAWRAHEAGRDDQAWSRIGEVARRMGADLPLFVAFYWADNRTGVKTAAQVGWFVDRLRDLGFSVAMPAESRRRTTGP